MHIMLAALVFATVAVALGLAPWRRPLAAPRGRVVRTGVATDYCVQTLGCTREDAVKAEAKMLPQVANSVRIQKAEKVCAELRAKLGLSDADLRKLVLRVPTVLTLNMDKNVNPKLDWLQERLDLSRDELKKICLTLPATLAYSVDKNLEPKLSYFEHELGMSPREIRSKIISMPARLGYSIEKRYRPRLAAIRATAGADPAAVIDRIRAADAEFCKRTGVSIDTLRREQARVRRR